MTKEALPIIRYRTRDVGMRMKGECECGRTFVRMIKPAGRTDDMLIIRGVNVYPSQIESVILSFDGIEPYYQILISRENFLDKVEVEVEVSSEIFSDEIKVLENLRNKIEEKIKAELNLSCSIKLIKPKSITRSEGKAKRVIDLRKKEGFS